jgi:hypothetical protein
MANDRKWREDDHRPRPMIIVSKLYLFGNSQRVIDFDPEVPNGTFKFGVAKQNLDGSQVPSLLVDQGGLRSAHRMSSVGTRLKTNAADPAVNDPRVLSGREVGRLATSTREQVASSGSLDQRKPSGERDFRLLCHLELDGALCLLLDDSCAISDRAT